PQIDFRGVRSVWFERRAGALAARHGCMVVRDAFVESGGTYRTAYVEPGAIERNVMAPLRLSDGSRLDADAYVFACGPWLGKMFHDVPIQPTRQEVYFFGAPRGSERYMPPRMPVWIDFGERIVYGIPDTHGRGFKIADDTRGPAFDPTNGDRTPSIEGIARARRVLAERFPDLADAPVLESRVCQYENSPDGHLILDRHAAATNVWLAGGGSGHGFKLSPAVGEMMAAAILNGKVLPPLFRLDRLRKAQTQFG
ncbi:MAG: NAD(P)/FAD-dependent oxidoreductase, partial [Thermoanaerobaculia bacterium]